MRAIHPIIWLTCLSLGGGSCLAQAAADPVAASLATTNTGARAVLPPMPKPVSYFRQLLALSPAQLDAALAGIAEPARKKLRAKLQEYTALPPEQREGRLRATELTWYLAPLLRTPPTNRVGQLAIIPEECRPTVEEILKRWDALTPEFQKQLRDHGWTIPDFPPGQFGSRSPTPPLPPPLRDRLNNQLASWSARSPEQRRRMCDRFKRYFDLPQGEKVKTLSALSEVERREMEDTLQAFEKLTPEQRNVCLASFRQFANMTPDEQAQFLRNAEQWKEMSPEDRRTWRTLVTKLPPLPPGLGGPPKPPGFN